MPRQVQVRGRLAAGSMSAGWQLTHGPGLTKPTHDQVSTTSNAPQASQAKLSTCFGSQQRLGHRQLHHSFVGACLAWHVMPPA